MKRWVKKIFIGFKVTAGLAVLIAVGCAVYWSSFDVGISNGELLEPISMPEQAHYPKGILSAPILMYHNIRDSKLIDYYSVSPRIFKRQMQWLKDNGYRTVSYRQFMETLTGYSNLPGKSVVISFDDGYRNQYDSAFPILKEYGFTAIFFPYTRDIDKKNFFTWDMIAEMKAAGMEIGSHSVNHKRLTKLTREQIMYEAAESKRILENQLGDSVDFFAYPYGLYNLDTVEAVKLAGYMSAATVRPFNYSDKKDGLYFVPRVRVENNLESLINAAR